MKSFVLALAACGDNGTLTPGVLFQRGLTGGAVASCPTVSSYTRRLSTKSATSMAPIEGTKLVYIGSAATDFDYFGLVELP